MAYLGNTPVAEYYDSRTDQYNGDGNTTIFTLSREVATANDVEVVVNNVQQDPYTAFSASGTTLTFSEAPSLGSGNILVTYRNYLITRLIPNPQSVTSELLDTTGVVAGTYGSSSIVPVITVDATGRLTFAANAAITLGTIAIQDSNNVDITGGNVTSISTLSATDGTITNLNSGNANISGGNITASSVNATSQLYVSAYNYKRVDLGELSSNTTLDLSQGNYFKCSIQANSSVTFTTNNAPTGSVTTGFVLDMTGGGAATVSLASLGSSDTLFQGGTHPSISSLRDLYSCITADNGSTFCVLPIFVNGQ